MSGDTGVDIRYTVDGSTPSLTVGHDYSGLFSWNILDITTLKAIAFKDGEIRSDVVSKDIEISPVVKAIQTVTPTLTGVDITMTSATNTADIYYTNDGTIVTPLVGTKISNGFILNWNTVGDTDFQLLATKSGWAESPITMFTVSLVKIGTPSHSVINTLTGVKIMLSTSTPGTSIRYTLDGTIPTTVTGILLKNGETFAYEVESDADLNVIAFGSGMIPSDIYTSTITAVTKLATPVSETVDQPEGIKIVIKDASDDNSVTLRYTIDSSLPSSVQGNAVSHGYSFDWLDANGITLQVIAIKSGFIPSNVQSIPIDLSTIPTPIISPSDLIDGVSVSLTCSDALATITCTTGSSLPTKSSPVCSTFELKDSGDFLINALAYKPGSLESDIVTITQNMLQVDLPSYSIHDLLNGRQISFSTTTIGASIRYTTNGNTPTATSGISYSNGIDWTSLGTTTFKLVAYKAGMVVSDVVSFDVTVEQVNKPTQVTSDLEDGVVVVLNCDPSASIRYTIDGSVPSETVGTLVQQGHRIEINHENAVTIKAIAYSRGLVVSPMLVTPIDLVVSSTPLITTTPLQDGVRTSIVGSVGCILKTTNDGTVPSLTSGNVFTSYDIKRAGDTIIKAVVYCAGEVVSAVGEMIITLSAVQLPLKVESSIEGGVSVELNSNTVGSTLKYAIGADASQPSLTSGISAALGDTVEVYDSGLTTFQVRGFMTGMVKSDLLAFSVNLLTVSLPTASVSDIDGGVKVSFACDTPGASYIYTTDASDPTLNHGTPLANDAAEIIIQNVGETTFRFIGVKAGLAVSPIASKTVIAPIAANVGFAVADTSIGVEATLSSATSNAIIRYSTDPGVIPDLTTGTIVANNHKINWNTLTPVTIRAVAILMGNVVSPVTQESIALTQLSTPNVVAVDISGGIRLDVTVDAGSSIRYTLDGSDPTYDSGEDCSTGEVTFTSTADINAKFLAHQLGKIPSAIRRFDYTIERVEQPYFNVIPVESGIAFELITNTPGAEIRYTDIVGEELSDLNGDIFDISEPIEFTLLGTAKYTAIAWKPGMLTSTVLSFGATTEKLRYPQYTSTNLINGIEINVNCHADNISGEECKIRYTTDGSDPTMTHGVIGPDTFVWSSDDELVIRAIALRDGFIMSDIAEKKIVLSIIQDPVIAMRSELFGNTLTLHSLTYGAEIRYTIDGTIPSETVGTLVSNSQEITWNTVGSTIFKLVAFKSGVLNSQVVSQNINLDQVAKPTHELSDAENGQYVTLSCPTTDVMIKYTLDGITEPSLNTGIVYNDALLVTEDVTIKAIGIKTGMVPSEVASYDITTPVASDPTFVIQPLSTGIRVVMNTDTLGASLSFIVDSSSNPSEGVGTIIGSGGYYDILTDVPVTLKVVAWKHGMQPSSIISKTVTVPRVDTPVFSKVAADEGFVVTLTSLTSDATIRYTTNALLPSATSGNVMSNGSSFPITSAFTTKVQAIALKSGHVPSNMMVENMNIPRVTTPTLRISDGTPGSVVTMNVDDGATLRYTIDGSEPTLTHGTLYTAPLEWILPSTNFKMVASMRGYIRSTIGTAFVTIASVPKPVHMIRQNLEGVRVEFMSSIESAIFMYTTDGSIPTDIHGTELAQGGSFLINHTNSITVKVVAVASGLLISDIDEFTVHLSQVAEPTYTLASVANGVQVKLTSTTTSAQINYGIDVATPYITLSSTPVVVSNTGTTKIIAQAVKKGMVASDIVVFDVNVECGDGILTWNEECDDGNTDPSDGCSPQCTIEAGWECIGGSFTNPSSCNVDCPTCFTHKFFTEEWSSCSRECGGGVRTRNVVCRTAAGAIVPDSACIDAGVDKPTNEEVCNSLVCQSYGWITGSWGSCSVSCGGGLRIRSVSCEASPSGKIVLDSYCEAISRPSNVDSCGTGVCLIEYHTSYLIETASCSQYCDGGELVMDYKCLDKNNQEVDKSKCSANNNFGDCNQRTCSYGLYVWKPTTWSDCSKECYGERTRGLNCINSSGDIVHDAYCSAQTKPVLSESCNNGCVTVDTSRECLVDLDCSGRGTCSSTGECVCQTGFSAPRCTVKEGCSGVFDSLGDCCPGILTSHSTPQCCVGTNSATTPVLDYHGECCASGVLDACGICNGNAKTIDALGKCCEYEVDAMGLCTSGGSLDSCSVENGLDICPLILDFGETVDTNVFDESTDEYKTFINEFKTKVITVLEVSDSLIKEIEVKSDTGSRRRRMVEWKNDHSSRGRRQLASSNAVVSVTVFDTTTRNPVLREDYSSKITTEGSLSLKAISAGGMCGDGVCDVGERCEGLSDSDCCPSDCPLPLLQCPYPSGSTEPCGGHGICTEWLGTCSCFESAGYMGEDCSECSLGFFKSGSECLRIVSGSCHDGVMNQDEEGIDCGGICGGSCTDSPPYLMYGAIVVGVISFAAIVVLGVRWKPKHEHHLKNPQAKKRFSVADPNVQIQIPKYADGDLVYDNENVPQISPRGPPGDANVHSDNNKKPIPSPVTINRVKDSDFALAAPVNPGNNQLPPVEDDMSTSIVINPKNAPAYDEESHGIVKHHQQQKDNHNQQSTAESVTASKGKEEEVLTASLIAPAKMSQSRRSSLPPLHPGNNKSGTSAFAPVAGINTGLSSNKSKKSLKKQASSNAVRNAPQQSQISSHDDDDLFDKRLAMSSRLSKHEDNTSSNDFHPQLQPRPDSAASQMSLPGGTTAFSVKDNDDYRSPEYLQAPVCRTPSPISTNPNLMSNSPKSAFGHLSKPTINPLSTNISAKKLNPLTPLGEDENANINHSSPSRGVASMVSTISCKNSEETTTIKNIDGNANNNKFKKIDFDDDDDEESFEITPNPGNITPDNPMSRSMIAQLEENDRIPLNPSGGVDNDNNNDDYDEVKVMENNDNEVMNNPLSYEKEETEDSLMNQQPESNLNCKIIEDSKTIDKESGTIGALDALVDETSKAISISSDLSVVDVKQENEVIFMEDNVNASPINELDIVEDLVLTEKSDTAFKNDVLVENIDDTEDEMIVTSEDATKHSIENAYSEIQKVHSLISRNNKELSVVDDDDDKLFPTETDAHIIDTETVGTNDGDLLLLPIEKDNVVNESMSILDIEEEFNSTTSEKDLKSSLKLKEEERNPKNSYDSPSKVSITEQATTPITESKPNNNFDEIDLWGDLTFEISKPKVSPSSKKTRKVVKKSPMHMVEDPLTDTIENSPKENSLPTLLLDSHHSTEDAEASQLRLTADGNDDTFNHKELEQNMSIISFGDDIITAEELDNNHERLGDLDGDIPFPSAN
eukprot:TRINITY_DN4854_c0_g3_i14.p1 TRINITY_DN4854_c0_g3~~TRINITY_DN4854_c0_g3_i14.p1  ORF type:complete len:3558 (-),score=1428.50 TRINITY_DN4854_c0_g3_i14:281-10087(-)